MSKFGLLKNKIINKFTESYTSGDKSKIKFLNNVIYVTEVKINFYKKIFNFCSWTLSSILKKNK